MSQKRSLSITSGPSLSFSSSSLPSPSPSPSVGATTPISPTRSTGQPSWSSFTRKSAEDQRESSNQSRQVSATPRLSPPRQAISVPFPGQVANPSNESSSSLSLLALVPTSLKGKSERRKLTVSEEPTIGVETSIIQTVSEIEREGNGFFHFQDDSPLPQVRSIQVSYLCEYLSHPYIDDPQFTSKVLLCFPNFIQPDGFLALIIKSFKNTSFLSFGEASLRKKK